MNPTTRPALASQRNVQVSSDTTPFKSCYQSILKAYPAILSPENHHRGALLIWIFILLVFIGLTSFSFCRERPQINAISYYIVCICVALYMVTVHFRGIWHILILGTQRHQHLEESEQADVEQSSSSKDESGPKRNIHYLNNLKVFLVAMVVSHHVSCSFGSGGLVWPLVIQSYDPNDDPHTKSIYQRFDSFYLFLNQGYFVPLFFFISAYFTPPSFNRKEPWHFHYDKVTRLGIPLVLVTFGIFPATIMIAQAIAKKPITYIPMPGQAWFLFWLIIFNVVYSTVAVRNKTVFEDMQIPSSYVRIVILGIVVCGLGTLGIFVLLDFKAYFFFMPITVGSLPCDILMYITGIAAYHNGWLEKPLREQLGMRVWLLWLFIIAEIVGLFFVIQLQNEKMRLIKLLLAGIYCLDVSLALLQFFQAHFNRCTRFSKFLSDAAYTVYLIHPVVVTGCSALYVLAYRNGGYGEGIEFEDEDWNLHTYRVGEIWSLSGKSQIAGPDNGGLAIWIGELVCNVVCHLICWPLAWILKQLPVLNRIL